MKAFTGEVVSTMPLGVISCLCYNCIKRWDWLRE
nr:MAG TPA: hypothetical protein [Bacteriophage sp.]